MTTTNKKIKYTAPTIKKLCEVEVETELLAYSGQVNPNPPDERPDRPDDRPDEWDWRHHPYDRDPRRDKSIWDEEW